VLTVGNQNIYYIGPGRDFETLRAGMQGMGAGDTLIIENGIYDVSSRDWIIHGTEGSLPHSGTSTSFTTVIGEDPWKVIFNGQSSSYDFIRFNSRGNPSSEPAHHLAFKGFEVHNTLNWIMVNGVSWIKLIDIGVVDSGRVNAYNGGNQNVANLGVSASSNVLLEWIYSWGYSRYKILTYQADHVIIRRSLARIDGYHGTEPLGIYQMYCSQNIMAQNNLAIDGDQKEFWTRTYYSASAFSMAATNCQDNTPTNVYKRSIALNNKRPLLDNAAQESSVPWTRVDIIGWDLEMDRGDAGSGWNYDLIWLRGAWNVTQATIGDINVDAPGYENNGFLNVPYQPVDITNSIFYRLGWDGAQTQDRGRLTNEWSGVGSVSLDFNSIYDFKNDYASATQVSRVSVTNTRETDPRTEGLNYLPRLDSDSILRTAGKDGERIGAEVMTFVGKSGTFYGEPGWDDETGISMWPFPHEDLFKEKFADYSFVWDLRSWGTGTLDGARGFAASGTGIYGWPVTLTSYIWEYLGNICPEDICDYGLSSTGTLDTTVPSLSNWSPDGELVSGTTNVNLTLDTDENAFCKYSTTADTVYSSLINSFSTTWNRSHSTNIAGLTDGTSYRYYVRCVDWSSNENFIDYEINFSIANNIWGNTYYLSTTWSDSNIGSNWSPWSTFSHAWTQLIAWDTLIVKNWVYNEQINPSISWTPWSPITVQAENIGWATIEMLSTVPITCSSGATEHWAWIYVCSNTSKTISHIVIDGFYVRWYWESSAISVTGADNVSIAQMSNNITIRNTWAFWSAALTNKVVFDISRSRDSLFEDVYAYGVWRKAMQVYWAIGITVRRAVLRFDYWDGSSYKPNDPRVNFSWYNTIDSTFENIISIDAWAWSWSRAWFVASGNNAAWAAVSASSNNKYLWLVSYNNIWNWIEINGWSGSPVEGIYVKDSVFWWNTWVGMNIHWNATWTTLEYVTSWNNGLTWIRIDPYNASITNSIIRNTYSVGNDRPYVTWWATQVAVFENNTASWNTNDYYSTYPRNMNTAYAPIITNIVNPGYVIWYERWWKVMNKYVDWVLTWDGLWPWKNEVMIKQHMCDNTDLAIANRTWLNSPTWCNTSKTLTEYIWQATWGVSDTTAPVISNGFPTGEQASGTTNVNLTLDTDENATCRYSTSVNTTYTGMSNTFSTTWNTSHSTNITGLTNGNSYTYYIRCIDGTSNENTSDYTINFSIAATVSSGWGGWGGWGWWWGGWSYTPTCKDEQLTCKLIPWSSITYKWYKKENVSCKNWKLWSICNVVEETELNSVWEIEETSTGSNSWWGLVKYHSEMTILQWIEKRIDKVIEQRKKDKIEKVIEYRNMFIKDVENYVLAREKKENTREYKVQILTTFKLFVKELKKENTVGVKRKVSGYIATNDAVNILSWKLDALILKYNKETSLKVLFFKNKLLKNLDWYMTMKKNREKGVNYKIKLKILKSNIQKTYKIFLKGLK